MMSFVNENHVWKIAILENIWALKALCDRGFYSVLNYLPHDFCLGDLLSMMFPRQHWEKHYEHPPVGYDKLDESEDYEKISAIDYYLSRPKYNVVITIPGFEKVNEDKLDELIKILKNHCPEKMSIDEEFEFFDEYFPEYNVIEEVSFLEKFAYGKQNRCGIVIKFVDLSQEDANYFWENPPHMTGDYEVFIEFYDELNKLLNSFFNTDAA